MQATSNFYMFFGRFHPLFVHLPIGLLAFAIFMEVLLLLKPRENYQKIMPLVWLLAALSAILSAGSGYFLSQGGGYTEETLYQHKVGGIVLSLLSTLCCVLHWFPIPFIQKATKPIRSVLVVVVAVLLVFTGHWGGSLTHGSDYLTKFSPLSTTAVEIEKKTTPKIVSLDSADIFNQAVMPILQAKCVSCHNSEKQKGELLLTSYQDILNGGKTGKGIVPGNLSTSELYRRITLPKDHKEFMPTDGKTPLNETQVAILEWWIETGAHKNIMVADLHPNKKMQDVFGDYFQLGRAAILSYTADPAAESDISALVKAGFQVYAISETSNLLEIKYTGVTDQKPNLDLLKNVKDQLVWLQLTNCGLTDEDIEVVGELTNLFKLNLNRNKIGDKGIQSLRGLSKLEYLNVYGTEITDSSISAMVNLPNLKQLYVWETAVDTNRMAMNPVVKKGLEIVYKLEP
jgi:uncharacterized membrane protein